MVFDSLVFIVFFVVVFGLYASSWLSWKAKKVMLTIASYLFYAAWDPVYVLLLWTSTVVDWFAGRAMSNARSWKKKRILLVVSLATNLGLLGYFKYGGFVLENLQIFLHSMGVNYEPATWSIVLPVGISFYTFQTLSYTIDIYRNQLEPCDEFVDFALFVTFFPQLVAGPIVRAADFLPQLRTPRPIRMDQVGWGLTLLIIGLFEKVVLADTFLAPVVDMVYNSEATASVGDAWIATLAFSGQIFFDFAGYSICAIGVALCLGFALPDNFRTPYGAVGFSDFWRRWHISLSTWLRDYLYISLGGNRQGKVRTYINLSLTMLLGGLWHGASWAFVVWGALHGAYLVIERLIRRILRDVKLARTRFALLMGWMATFVAVCYAWVFFRATTFERAWELVLAMTGKGSLGLSMVSFGNALTVAGVVFPMLIGHWLMRNTTLKAIAERLPWWVISLILSLLILSIAMSAGDERAFIYFQF